MVEEEINKEDLDTILWDWHVYHIIKFLETIDDYEIYVYKDLDDGPLKLHIDWLLEDFFRYQEKYQIIDDEKQKQWCIKDRKSHMIIAIAPYTESNKHFIEISMGNLLSDLNNRRIQLR